MWHLYWVPKCLVGAKALLSLLASPDLAAGPSHVASARPSFPPSSYNPPRHPRPMNKESHHSIAGVTFSSFLTFKSHPSPSFLLSLLVALSRSPTTPPPPPPLLLLLLLLLQLTAQQ